MVKAVVCKSWEAFDKAGPGAICKEADSAFSIKCPGCGKAMFIDIRPTKATISWELSGFPDHITLHPSFVHQRNGRGCGWHGWLRDGIWESC